MPYGDVPEGVWFRESVQAFLDAGYLDPKQKTFRPVANATRAEFLKLVVEQNGGVLQDPPAVPSFTDAGPNDWFYGVIEESAKEGWMLGDGNCYGSTTLTTGSTNPCRARPNERISRAEAAILIVRAFGIEGTGRSPRFIDVGANDWFMAAVSAAADHCILQGDPATQRVRPFDPINRAEMVTMLFRVDQNLEYGYDCGGKK